MKDIMTKDKQKFNSEEKSFEEQERELAEKVNKSISGLSLLI